MRTMAVIATTAATALGAAPVAGAAAPGGEDYAVGTWQNQIARVSFAAHGGPSPLPPVRGHFAA